MRKAFVAACVINRMILRVMKLRKAYTGDVVEMEREVALLGPQMEVRVAFQLTELPARNF